jgi:hypothetical protein
LGEFNALGISVSIKIVDGRHYEKHHEAL